MARCAPNARIVLVWVVLGTSGLAVLHLYWESSYANFINRLNGTNREKIKNVALPAVMNATDSSPTIRSIIHTDLHHFTNNKKVPWTKDYYEPGHDNLDHSKICQNNGKELRVLMMVTTASANAQARLSVRKTWGALAQRRDVGLGFLVARSLNSRVQQAVEQEFQEYGDIIRGRSIEAYDNLTLKALSMLEWVHTYCRNVPFVLKTDDDMFINVDNLLSFVHVHRNSKRTIFGSLAHGWKPNRDRRSKWYISTDLFQLRVFPNFTTGPSYLVTGDAVLDLYEAAMQLKYFKLEDVFLTGITAEVANVTRVQSDGFVNAFSLPVANLTHCELTKSISFHNVKSKEQFSLWWKLFGIDGKC